MVQTRSNLRSANARGWGRNDDLSNGAWLDNHCPRKNRASDIDSEPGHHILHNCHVWPHREATIEYKRIIEGNGQRSLSVGQEYLLRDRPGRWYRQEDKLQKMCRVFIISHEGMNLTERPIEILPDGSQAPLDIVSADALGLLICKWVWPA